METALLTEERRRREEAETTLALLREKTKAKFFTLKTENENLKKLISELSEQRSIDSDWLGLQDSLKSLEADRKSLQTENDQLKHELATLTEPYDRVTHALPVHTVSASSSVVFAITRDSRVFRTPWDATFPVQLDVVIGNLKDEISELQRSLAAAAASAASAAAAAESVPEVAVSPSPAVGDPSGSSSSSSSVLGDPRTLQPNGPWTLERERLSRLIDQLEDSLENERRCNRESADELAELRRQLRSHEVTHALISNDDTKIMYAKNVFSKLFTLAPRGCPEFEQLLLVLCAFFHVDVDDPMILQRKQRLESSSFFHF